MKVFKILTNGSPADVMTKHLLADMLERHLEATCMVSTGGSAAYAPQLNAREPAMFLREAPPEPKAFRFAATGGQGP